MVPKLFELKLEFRLDDVQLAEVAVHRLFCASDFLARRLGCGPNCAIFVVSQHFLTAIFFFPPNESNVLIPLLDAYRGIGVAFYQLDLPISDLQEIGVHFVTDLPDLQCSNILALH